jgi:hypothetical protein
LPAGYPLWRPPGPKQKEGAKILTYKAILYSINFPKSFVKSLKPKIMKLPAVSCGEARFVSSENLMKKFVDFD